MDADRMDDLVDEWHRRPRQESLIEYLMRWTELTEAEIGHWAATNELPHV